MKCDENYEKWGGHMFFSGQTHLVHDTKWGGGGGSSPIFPKSHLVIMVFIWRAFRPPQSHKFLIEELKAKKEADPDKRNSIKVGSVFIEDIGKSS